MHCLASKKCEKRGTVRRQAGGGVGQRVVGGGGDLRVVLTPKNYAKNSIEGYNKLKCRLRVRFVSF